MKEFKAINAGEGAMIHAQLLEMTTLPQHQWLGVVVQDHVLTLVPGERSAMDIRFGNALLCTGSGGWQRRCVRRRCQHLGFC